MILISTILLLSALQAQEPDEVCIFEVILNDRQHVRGRVTPPSLKFTSEFGENDLDWRKIERLSWDSNARKWVILTQGTSLKGDLKLPDLALVTSAGTLTLKPDSIVTIAVSWPRRPGASPGNTTPGAAKDPNVIELRQATGGAEFREILITADGKYLVTLSASKGQCVFIERSTGAITQAPVDDWPVRAWERSGTLHVFNGNSGSISLIDLATRRTTGRIGLGIPCGSIAVPAVGDVAYALGTDGRTAHVIDLKAGMSLGGLTGEVGTLACTPDGRYLYGPRGCSILRGRRAIRISEITSTAEQPVYVDWTANRTYCGAGVYTLDMRRKLTDLPVFRCFPHPTLPVILGLRTSGKRALLSFDADSYAPLKEIVGEFQAQAIAFAEDAIYVLEADRIRRFGVADFIPPEYAKKSRKVRIAGDPTKAPGDADIARAATLADEGETLRKGGKLDAARAKFEEAVKLDPLSGGAAGSALCTTGDDAIEALVNAAAVPARDPKWTLTVIETLARAYVAAGRRADALDVLRTSLWYDRRHVPCLILLATLRLEDGKTESAYALLSRALEENPSSDEARKKLAEVQKTVRNATRGPCGDCNGKGKEEVVVEIEGGKTERVSQKCTACDGLGKAWKQPCAGCEGTRRYDFYSFCRKCLSRGFFYVPDRD